MPSNLLPPFALGIVLGSMLPDVDMYPVGIATAFGAKFDIYAVHRTAAHSLLLILAVLAVGLCIPRRRPGRATALGLSLGFATHALLDIFFWFAPIDLFWPLHDVLPNVRLVDPINLWSAVHLPGWAISLRDSFEFGAFALYLLALRRVIRAVAVNDDGEAGLLRAEVILWALFLITLATSTVASTKLQQVLVFTPLLLFAMPYCWLQTWRYRREIGAWCANPAQKSVWTNWDDTLRDIPDQVRFPGSFDEVQEIVREARAAGKHVRVFGAGHSWSSLVPCKDILVSLDRLDKAEVKDPANRLVTVQAGIRLRDLGPWLREHGLALRNTGAVTAQSIAGAISTGTHGTGLGYGVMGTQLVEAKVVDGLGNLRTVTPANADELAAIRMSLGSLGIIVEATLECAKDHHVELTEIPMRFDDFVTNLNQLLKDNERVRAYWFPGSTRILVNTMNSKEKELGPGPVWPSSAVFSRSVLMGAMWRLGQCIHLLIPLMNRLQEILGYRPRRVVGHIFEAITTPMPPRHQEAEIAVPLERAADALREYARLIAEGKGVINVQSEIRFAAGDDILLSPCNGRPVCYIGGYTATYIRDDPFFKTFMNTLQAKFDGRPHWGKLGVANRATAQKCFPGFSRFETIRARFDPDGVFANEFTSELFGI